MIPKNPAPGFRRAELFATMRAAHRARRVLSAAEVRGLIVRRRLGRVDLERQPVITLAGAAWAIGVDRHVVRKLLHDGRLVGELGYYLTKVGAVIPRWNIDSASAYAYAAEFLLQDAPGAAIAPAPAPHIGAS